MKRRLTVGAIVLALLAGAPATRADDGVSFRLSPPVDGRIVIAADARTRLSSRAARECLLYDIGPVGDPPVGDAERNAVRLPACAR